MSFKTMAKDNNIAWEDKSAFATAIKDNEVSRLLTKEPSLLEEKVAILINLLSNRTTNYDIVEILLKAGASPNVGNSFNTPLTLAIEKGDVKLVQLLLSHKADTNLKDNFNRIPLLNAVKQAIDKKSTVTLEIVEALLKAGANPNIGDNFDTPLALAIEKEDVKLVQLLLTYKADPNLKGRFQETAFLAALKNGNKELVDLCLKHNASIEPIKDLLDFYSYTLNSDMLSILEKQGFKVSDNGKIASKGTGGIFAGKGIFIKAKGFVNEGMIVSGGQIKIEVDEFVDKGTMIAPKIEITKNTTSDVSTIGDSIIQDDF